MPSRYDSRDRRMKEQHPHRVNAVAGLCHRIFRPDPEELKRRWKLRKKKLQQMEEDDDDEDNSDMSDDEVITYNPIHLMAYIFRFFSFHMCLRLRYPEI